MRNLICWQRYLAMQAEGNANSSGLRIMQSTMDRKHENYSTTDSALGHQINRVSFSLIGFISVADGGRSA